MRECLPPVPPRTPSAPLPAGATDTHCHVIGPETLYPFSSERTYTPKDAPVDSYRHLRSVLGIDRSVVVQPGAHGFDNRVTLDAIRSLGAATARGIAVVPRSVTDKALADLDDGGIRGIRLSTLLRGEDGIGGLPELAERVAPLGWHILIHLKESSELIDLAPMLRTSPAPIVIDHMARTHASEGVGSVQFQTLLDLLADTDHCWTKICSWYRLSDDPSYAAMESLAKAVIATRPDRILWGTNWPHPLLFDPPVPDDAYLVDQFMGWAGDLAEQILVANPERLYGFDGAAGVVRTGLEDARQ